MPSSLAKSVRAIEYTAASLQRDKTPPPPMSVLGMILNNLMMGLHLMLSFGECGVPPSLSLLPGPLRSVVVAPDTVLTMGQIEVFDIKTVQTNGLCSIELLEIELLDHLTVCIDILYYFTNLI